MLCATARYSFSPVPVSPVLINPVFTTTFSVVASPQSSHHGPSSPPFWASPLSWPRYPSWKSPAWTSPEARHSSPRRRHWPSCRLRGIGYVDWREQDEVKRAADLGGSGSFGCANGATARGGVGRSNRTHATFVGNSTDCAVAMQPRSAEVDVAASAVAPEAVAFPALKVVT